MPPFVPVTVKVTVVPEQTLVALELMLTLGIRLFVTVNVMSVEVAEVLEIQVGNVPPAVWIALITSPLVGM